MLEKEFVEAIVKGDTQKVVILLGQINNTGPIKEGRNALHLAAEYGNADIVSVLLLSGLFDCKITDSVGFCALQIAAAEGHVEIVKQLIKCGSNINSSDNVHGNTALHEAGWKGYSQTVAELAKAKINLDAKNWGGFTALHLTCQSGHNQSCRELLLLGATPDVQNNYGDTPLHTSARYGHAGVMRILISAQCRVSDQNKNGDTALHIAAAMNRRKLTRILLEANCDKYIVNKQNETAEDIAVRKKHEEIIEILRNTVKLSEKQLKPNKQTTSCSKEKNVNNGKNQLMKFAEKNKHFTPTVTIGGTIAIPWSPYGCHDIPDNRDFPEPNLDSLPTEPLQKGEQYYLDLAGNIRKGPVGVGYSCFCAPMFQTLETKLQKKTNKIKKEILRAEGAINKRIDTLEYFMENQRLVDSKFQCSTRGQQLYDYSNSLSQSQSLESIFDRDSKKNKQTVFGQRDILLRELSEKRRNILHLSSQYTSNCIDVSSRVCANENPHCITGKKNAPNNYVDDEFSKKLWKSSRVQVLESCESSDEGCDKVHDNACADSGYSTKLCSNSQGPSPSLSGRLEIDGLSVIPTHKEKQIPEMISNSITKNPLNDSVV